MSADLFAEFAADTSSDQPQSATAKPAAPLSDFSFFDSFNTPPPAPVAQAQPPPPQQHFPSFAPTSTPAIASDDQDDWGDFEGESSTTQQAPPAQPDLFGFSTPPAPAAQHLSIPQRPAASTQDSFAFVLQQSTQPDQQTWQRAPIIKAKKSADPSVLFDAEDVIEDDDFGDFEGGGDERRPPPPTTNSSALVDLLGELSVSQPKPPASSEREGVSLDRTSKSPSRRKKSLVGGFGVTTTSQPKVGSTIAPASKEDDSWETFDDWEASIPTKGPTSATTKSEPVKPVAAPSGIFTSLPIVSPTSEDARPGELPPTNVPPPGVLLSLFPSLFADAQEKLFKPMAAQPLPMRNKLMAEPATIAYLQGYLILANVAAHIIAGRKLRWKRDQHLSQGMRIGPASSRATSGMKLSGIDKGENLKEEREVSDVVRAWKEQVGRLRHVLSGINQIKAGTLGRGPDLQEAMPVKTLKQAEGGIPARQPCMMCGLKREERVTPADMELDDSFGEWWIDQVNMHRGCRNFWNQHKDTLRQR
ncbi:hypothetical protein BKA63DRAFT_80510 [Paraphoma chrysanthemicola]|nr:hypothetical protein BKA63DRAFT_80510 [Paraphoma chrysanthemicola]